MFVEFYVSYLELCMLTIMQFQNEICPSRLVLYDSLLMKKILEKENMQETTAAFHMLFFYTKLGTNFIMYGTFNFSSVKTHSHTMTPFDAPEKQAF